eukprot:TRINITY_DN81526_c0_g1_i1.p1 TRINITY_DN81526_c0_g1~~TRINITY_DN81526_c0_g1_i1.p1  ORF type:complete len:406 (-),score=89.31 TRINITY_DN81526_c0_g1_i1:7-1110(-)
MRGENTIGELGSRVLLRVPGSSRNDMILPASCLDLLPEPGQEESNLHELFEEHSIGSIPGVELGYIRQHSVQGLPVCITGDSKEDVDATAKRCESLGLRTVLTSSADSTQLRRVERAEEQDADKRNKGTENIGTHFVKPHNLIVSHSGEEVPYLKPRTSLKPEERQQLRLPAATRRAAALGQRSLTAGSAKAALVDDEAAESSRALRVKTSLLRQIDSVISESVSHASGNFDAVHFKVPDFQIRSSLQEIAQLSRALADVASEGWPQTGVDVRQPLEVSLIHEQLAASAASVAQEFPNGSVPADRKAASESQQVGALRATAVRIRGSASSVYPFVKAVGKTDREGMQWPNPSPPVTADNIDPQGIKE